MSNLRAWIFRGEVLKQYRAFFRAIRKAPEQAQGELKEQVRAAFAAERAVDDIYAKKYLLSFGRAQLKYLEETLIMKH